MQILILGLLVLLNGMLAMAEIAIISVRKNRLRELVETGHPQAQIALDLANAPSRFLSTVQIGITLVGILAGAFGGTTLAENIANSVYHWPALRPYSQTIGIGIVVLGITFLNIIFGELVPKRIALHNPEIISLRIAPWMKMLSILMSPVVSALSLITDSVLNLLGIKTLKKSWVSDEEVLTLIREGVRLGIFESTEKEIVERIFQLSDQTVDKLMIPHTQIKTLDQTHPLEQIRAQILNHPRTFFPVIRGDLDHLAGLVKTQDLLIQVINLNQINWAELLQKPLLVDLKTPILTVLENFETAKNKLALVIDTEGKIQGLITLTDILQTITGQISPRSTLRK